MNIEYVKILPQFHDLIYYSKDLDKITDLPVLGILLSLFTPELTLPIYSSVRLPYGGSL